MKALSITAILVLGTTTFAFGQTPAQMRSQQNLSAPPALPGTARSNARRAATLERKTMGMGSREPAIEFMFSPGARDPQRNDLTVSPFGPMNNVG
jgi:hypothetical protein